MVRHLNVFHVMLRNRLSSALRSLLALSFIVFTATPIIAQDAANGENVFKAVCASCHMIDKDMTGPKLMDVTDRWAGKEELLKQWIKNPSEVKKLGDPYVTELLQKWEPKSGLMAAQAVNDAEIDDILAYIAAYVPPAPPKEEVKENGNGLTFDEMSLALLLVVGILLVILIMLLGLKAKLGKAIALKEEGEAKPSFIGEIIADIKYFITEQMNPTILVLTIGGIVTLPVLVIVFLNIQDLGSQQGYAPDQPIKFSHKLHAGKYNIDCQYCHTGVEKSKNANIPSANICMNCHKVVQSGPTYGTEEIAKIYAAIGFDPDKQTYSGQTKPIEWVRIHNLPDHVNFNHQQHVVAGNLDCENCHGNVREMEVVQQVSLLEMGWCINCHRETEVAIDNNFYQEHYQQVFEDDYNQFIKDNPKKQDVGIKEFVKEHKRYTIADLGGLECQRCHY
ncbi:MAG: c-type cytochrome [Bacteroidetes bacterium]|nr:c-type cytochrome [Bacteroidota bacterium]